ncbi:MAG: hypothetical protein QOE23_1018 [Pseudonocardiales bacterium]|jgi:hypothetical protein|nr:hypothetical protein [Pseudonocardiales bacterium]
MVSARRSATGALAGLLICPALAGCGGSAGNPGGPVQRPSTSLTGTATSPSRAGSSSPTPGTTSASSPSSAISIPPYLCSGTDIAQNAADAYLGALSAGDLEQASACVLPHTVPAAVTRGLLGSGGRTAAYLPRDGVDGPTVFGYRGNGKLIDVTVTKEPDGRFWVTGVAVRSG